MLYKGLNLLGILGLVLGVTVFPNDLGYLGAMLRVLRVSKGTKKSPVNPLG